MKNSSCLLDGYIDGKFIYNFYHGKDLIGEFHLFFLPGKIYIDWILIEEEFRGKGYGNEVVKFILEFCSKFSYLYSEIFLEVDFDHEHAQYLYKKFGFTFDDWVGNDFCYRMTYKF